MANLAVVNLVGVHMSGSRQCREPLVAGAAGACGDGICGVPWRRTCILAVTNALQRCDHATNVDTSKHIVECRMQKALLLASCYGLLSGDNVAAWQRH